MNSGFRLGDFEIYWLSGGRFALDGGPMFGVVPKALWSKKFPVGEDNTVSLITYPMLVKTPDAFVLIESGLGNKLTDKQKEIFKMSEEWNVIEDLNSLELTREDIDYVILSHYDFDHAGGVVMQSSDRGLELTFPGARHIIHKTEWEDVINPNIRSINTYWPVNNELLKSSPNLELIDGDREVTKGVKVIHAGGHTRGMQIVVLESKGQTAVYLADLLPTTANFNPLWITAYDNFPLEAIAKKKSLEDEYIAKGAWFIFYHDPQTYACRFDEQGNIVEQWPD